MNDARSTRNVVVVGGGPAGLAAAITAADAGATVVCSNDGSGLGGQSRTDEVDGAHLVSGPRSTRRCRR